jgi:hypothetical protein
VIADLRPVRKKPKKRGCNGAGSGLFSPFFWTLRKRRAVDVVVARRRHRIVYLWQLEFV